MTVWRTLSSPCVSFVRPFAQRRPRHIVLVHVIFSLALAWGLGTPVSGATPLLVQKASNRTSSATALNVAAVSPVTSGNLMVVGVSAWPNAPTSVTDTLGTTYTLAGAIRTSSGGAHTAIFYGRLTAGGANTVTYRTGGSNGQMAMVIAEFANIASPSPLDAATGAVGSGSVPSSGNLTPTVAGDLMIAAGTHEATLVTSAYPGSTMIAIATENSSTNQPLAMSYQVLTTTTPTPARFNLSASAPWAQAGALFKATASGDVTPPSAPTGLVISGVTTSSFTLSWTASTDNVAVSGYRVDVSTQSNFASFVTGYNNANLGNVVTTSVTGLTGSTTYFARLRAYDAALNTSGNSAVASTTTQTPPDVTPPGVAITSPASGATVAGSLTVLGTAADNVALSQVEVRVDSGVWNLASGLGNWSYSLNTLSLADGAHTIEARATDTSGNTNQASRSVTVDNTAPVITGVNASAITTSQATIGWQTNELSDSRVEYGETASYGSFSPLQSTPVLNHSVVISGLAPDTAYHYRVYSKDPAGNVAISADASFTTPAPAGDTVAPTLSILSPSDGAAVTGVVVASGSAADETGLLSVEVRVDAGAFNAATGLQNWTYNVDTSGLSSGPHTITVRATDTSANTQSASVGITVDRTAPVISNVAVAGISATGATVTWNTNEASNSQVEYWSASSPTLNVLNGAATLSHSMQLNDLSPATLYNYRVRSRDAAGNTGVSADDTFTTADSTLPIEVGSQIAGSFADATGHSAQNHLVFAENSGVWWLFTLTSTADSINNYIIKSYRSSGSDLRSATWTQGPSSPTATATNSSSATMGGGRALSVAYVNNAGLDVIHAEIAMAFDGQDGTVGHIRGRVSAGAITWESWNYHVEGAATWTLPRNTALGVSSGKFIHSGGTILQQEVDANVRKSTNADTGASWTSGFSAVAVVDNSMIHQSNSLAFAALDNNVMLTVYDNGGGPSCGFNCVPPGSPSEPNLNNLGYKRSNTNGSWTGVPVGGQGPGDGSVFASNAIINQNDWALVRLSSTTIYAFRKSGNGAGVDGASYNVAGNNWSPLAPQPPLFASGQAFKSGAGLFGATDGVNVWLFVINTDAANSILYTQLNGSGGFWTPWAAVAGTNSGTHTRGFISGDSQPRDHRISLLWTEGSNPYREMVTAFDTGLGGPDTEPPSLAVTSPVANATVWGVVTVAGTAGDNTDLDRVEVQVDAGAFASAAGLTNWTYSLDTQSLTDGPHTITARATDQAGNERSVSIGIVVDNTTPRDTTPPSVTISTPTAGATVTGTISVTGTASDNAALSLVEIQVDAGAYSAASGLASWSYSLNTLTLTNGSHTIRARATDSSGNTAVTTITVTVSNIVNVIANPGFESGTTQWSFPAAATIDSASPHSGVNAARIVRTTVGTSTVQNSPRVAVQAGSSYTAEVWVKTTSVANGNGARVVLQWFNSSGTSVGSTVLLTGSMGTTAWQKVSRSALVAPSTAVTARLQLQLSNATGTVWFDDTLLYK